MHNSMLILSYLCFVFSLSIHLIGCGASTERYEALTRCDALKSYAPQRYLNAQSRATTLPEARQRAEAEVARKISAEVRSLIEVNGKSKDGDVSDEVSEHIEISSHFKHADLFKPLKSCEGCIDHLCFSTVVLSRDRTAERLIQEMGGDLQLLNHATQHLNEESPLLKFTQAWRQVEEVRERITLQLNQVHALGRSTSALTNAQNIMSNAAKVRSKRLEKLWVHIKPLSLSGTDLNSSQQDSLREVVDGRFSEALGDLNLKRWTEEHCPIQQIQQQQIDQPDVIVIQPKGVLRCALGYVGPECQLKLSVHLTLCPQKLLTQDDWNSLRLVGVHSREPEGAITKLTQYIRATDFSRSLSETLSPLIIF